MFTPHQLLVLRAAIQRIVPPDGSAVSAPDDEFPGGWEAGAGDYLLRQLAPEGDLHALAGLYAAGLDALDAEARALSPGGKGFADLDAPAQDALLARVEAGNVLTGAWPPDLEPALFFRRFAEHVAEGFYSDPGNGGNKNGVSWKMIGFEVRG